MLFRFLFLLFVAAAAEVALLIFLMSRAGFFPTVAILLIAGLVGAVLARRQGLRAWRAIRDDLAARRAPAVSVVDGLLVLLAGLLLAFPGLISDLCGILLLVPQVRAALRPAFTGWLSRRVSLRVRNFSTRPPGQGEVIDAEFRRADAPALEDRTP